MRRGPVWLLCGMGWVGWGGLLYATCMASVEMARDGAVPAGDLPLLVKLLRSAAPSTQQQAVDTI
jgi:hypothetical protein